MNILAFVLVLAFGAGDADSPAVRALDRQLEYIDRGQYGRLYDELHPASQALVPEDDYIQCAQRAGPIDFGDYEVVEVYRERATIPGTERRVRTVAITIDDGDDIDTFHEVKRNGRWRWILGDPAAFADGECP